MLLVFYEYGSSSGNFQLSYSPRHIYLIPIPSISIRKNWQINSRGYIFGCLCNFLQTYQPQIRKPIIYSSSCKSTDSQSFVSQFFDNFWLSVDLQLLL